jgi:periplasmic protein TonB
MKHWLCGVAVASLAIASTRAQSVVYTPGNGVTAPKVVQRIRPVYPAAAEKAHRQGTVMLDCVVDKDGTVAEVSVTRSSDDAFGDAAVAAAWQFRFTPGTKDGQPVAVRVSLEITFSLHGRYVG